MANTAAASCTVQYSTVPLLGSDSNVTFARGVGGRIVLFYETNQYNSQYRNTIAAPARGSISADSLCGSFMPRTADDFSLPALPQSRNIFKLLGETHI